MTISEKKKIEELLLKIDNKNDFFIIGCGECATSCKTGGEAEVLEMKELLESKEKKVVGHGVCDTTCDIRILKKFIRQNKESFGQSKTLLMLSCGAGSQAIRQVSDKDLISGIDTMFLGTIQRLGNFDEYCSECGHCTITDTFGFCTKTRCAKGLVNGPCGNAIDGNCELGNGQPCVWVEIYDFLKSRGREKEFFNISIKNDYSNVNKPRKIENYKKK